VQSFADAASEQRAQFAGVKQFLDRFLRRTELACRTLSGLGSPANPNVTASGGALLGALANAAATTATSGGTAASPGSGAEVAYTVLTQEAVGMCWSLVRFNFYDFGELLRLADVLLAILDSRHISQYGTPACVCDRQTDRQIHG
jgi:hypothetical protein